MLQKGCHGQTAESQVGTIKVNSQPDINQCPKTKTARRQNLQISSWTEI